MCGLPALGPCSGTQLDIEGKTIWKRGSNERLDTTRLPALSLNQFRLHTAYFTVKVGLWKAPLWSEWRRFGYYAWYLKKVNMSESRRLPRAWAPQETGRRAPRNWPVYVTPMKWDRQGGFPVRVTCKECAATCGQCSARQEQHHDAQVTNHRRTNK